MQISSCMWAQLGPKFQGFFVDPTRPLAAPCCGSPIQPLTSGDRKSDCFGILEVCYTGDCKSARPGVVKHPFSMAKLFFMGPFFLQPPILLVTTCPNDQWDDPPTRCFPPYKKSKFRSYFYSICRVNLHPSTYLFSAVSGGDGFYPSTAPEIFWSGGCLFIDPWCVGHSCGSGLDAHVDCTGGAWCRLVLVGRLTKIDRF